MHAFLLIGQSNMAGRGYLNEARDIDTSRIYILRNGRWQTMFRPINPDRSFSGVNLAESFAEAYVKKHNTDVGLICCADGGTTIDQWQPGELLYDNAIAQAKLAMRTSKLAGILWHQGESDCCASSLPCFRSKLVKMLTRLREDLNADDIPILLGGLGDFLFDCPRPDWELGNHTIINEELQAVADADRMNGFVSAEGLTSNPDFLHFNAASLYEFGLRYFTVFETFKSACENPHASNTKSGILRSEMELL